MSEFLNRIVDTKYSRLGRAYFCALTLDNGFTINGDAIDDSFNDLDHDLGKEQARLDAIDNLQAIIAYDKKEQVYRSIQPVPTAQAEARAEFGERPIGTAESIDAEKPYGFAEAINDLHGDKQAVSFKELLDMLGLGEVVRTDAEAAAVNEVPEVRDTPPFIPDPIPRFHPLHSGDMPRRGYLKSIMNNGDEELGFYRATHAEDTLENFRDATKAGIVAWRYLTKEENFAAREEFGTVDEQMGITGYVGTDTVEQLFAEFNEK